MGAEEAPSPRLQTALSLLAEEIRARIARAPGGHLLAGRGDEIELRLVLGADPLAPADAPGQRRRVGDLDRALEETLTALIRHRAAWAPGHVTCLRCAETPCAHSRPAAPREVFVGYGPSGLPRFVDFAQWLLELRDPRLDRLYASTREPRPGGGRPGPERREPATPSGPRGWPLVTRTLGHELLHADLLEAYTRSEGPRLAGVLNAGFWGIPDPHGVPTPMALSFLALATPAARGRWRLGLDLVGIGPAGQAPTELAVGSTLPPWAGDVAFAQGELRRLERHPQSAVDLERRVQGVLRELAGRLEHADRARERRTRHGEERHRQGDRPTRQALADLARVPAEQIYFDLRRQTLVVVGDRGRTHVFNRDGRLVTSLRSGPDTVPRKLEQRIWRPAKSDEITRLRTLAASSELAGAGADEPAAATDAASEPTTGNR
jgi:hypothetical protein